MIGGLAAPRGLVCAIIGSPTHLREEPWERPARRCVCSDRRGEAEVKTLAAITGWWMTHSAARLGAIMTAAEARTN